MKKALFILLVILSIITLAVRFGFKPAQKVLGLESKAGVKITAIPNAKVWINDEEVGETPYQTDSLSPVDYLIKLSQGELSWQGRVNLHSGTMTVVNRELGESIASSSGEVLSLLSGRGVIVTSTPQSSTVEADGKSYGTTPLAIKDIAPGEHNFIISKDGYLKRSIKANLPENYTLNLDVTLAIAEADLTAISAPVITQQQVVIVSKTPTGFLRVRDRPSTSGNEVTRLSTGEKLVVLSEEGAWFRIRTSDGREGYVSASYVQK